MDNFGTTNAGSGDAGESTPVDDNKAGSSKVSHKPLHLGDSSTIKVPPELREPTKKPTTKAPAVKPTTKAPTVKPITKAPTGKVTSSPDRITGVRTFFTKLHAGAIEFLDEQITDWLKKNPDITIKLTNTVTGEIQGKKTEPNIIITVWY